ncbi:MAG: DUF5696 domain-containing protein [Anaerolineae bacterium]|nr:DUF5696 domain-containing protein [Anaerolineae bacterium]
MCGSTRTPSGGGHFRSDCHLNITHLLSLLTVIMLLSGCRGASLEAPQETSPRLNPPLNLPPPLESWPSLEGRHPDVPTDYEPIAESTHLRLYLKKATSALIVEDRRSGRLWRSAPADLKEVKLSQAWRRRIEAPVLLGYTDADRGRANTAKPEGAEIDYMPVEGGVRAHYRFAEEGFEFSVYYVIRDDFLELTIPEKEVVEYSAETGNTLVSVDVLPFLGATHDGEEGYIVFPDGSGALMSFTSPHPEAVQEISVPVYGQEQVQLQRSDYTYQCSIPIPLFGLVSGDGAFAAVITQGDFDALIGVGRSGKSIPYNHVWASFVYRRQGQFSLMGGQPAWLYEPDMVRGDRQVRYYFLTAEAANYVGIASRYRAFLIEERGARRVGQDMPLMTLTFFMGVERRTWFMRELVRTTSFADVQRIVEDLASAGVTRIDVTLEGWNKGGAESRYPQRLPVERRLGGEEGLRALAAYLRARSIRLFLSDNYLLALPGGGGIFPYSDAVRGVDGLPVGGGGVYLINPQVALRRFAVRDLPRMAELGASGLWLNYFAGLALPDTNDRYPLGRENFAASWMQIARLAREQFGAVAMYGDNGYAVPHADRLDYVQLDSTHYDMFDETIPLYQIAVHGLVLYSGQPYNLMNDGRRTQLRQIEYGAIPNFVLTYESPALLARTSANWLWSSQYEFWRPEIIRQYQDMEELAHTLDRFIVGHTRLASNVYQTTYEDGTRVIVNYTDQPYTAGTLTVPALDFVVLRGGE